MYIETLPQVYLRCKYVNRSFLNCEKKKINSLALVAAIITLHQLHPATGCFNQWCCYGGCLRYLKSSSPNVQIYVDSISSGPVMREGKKKTVLVPHTLEACFYASFLQLGGYIQVCLQPSALFFITQKRDVACMTLVFLLGFFLETFFSHILGICQLGNAFCQIYLDYILSIYALKKFFQYKDLENADTRLLNFM